MILTPVKFENLESALAKALINGLKIVATLWLHDDQTHDVEAQVVKMEGHSITLMTADGKTQEVRMDRDLLGCQIECPC